MVWVGSGWDYVWRAISEWKGKMVVRVSFGRRFKAWSLSGCFGGRSIAFHMSELGMDFYNLYKRPYGKCSSSIHVSMLTFMQVIWYCTQALFMILLYKLVWEYLKPPWSMKMRCGLGWLTCRIICLPKQWIKKWITQSGACAQNALWRGRRYCMMMEH